MAEALKWEFLDLDAEIVANEGRAISDIFASDGEKAFREIESATLKRVTNGVTSPTIISLGGGTLLDNANRALALANGTVWCLDPPSEEELAKRIADGGASRPLGNKAAERAVHYNSFPSRIAAWFDLPGSLVVIGTGLGLPGNPALFVADENTFAAQKPLFDNVFAIPSGEKLKNLETVSSIWHAFSVAGLGRRDVVAAFGGGVTGDLTGFAAATWMRGIRWINFPTSLLSMVDASTGGKTGCDLKEGKNLIGAFHSPSFVAIDTDRLSTLPERELRNGRAEMIKHEVISGTNTFDPERKTPTAAEIAANLSVKVGIVREDPFEIDGRRILLNCGHTIGHALEIATDFAIAHGEAVAIGCVEEARLAVRLGLASPKWPDALATRFARSGLPTTLPQGMDFETLAPIMRGDKKRNGNGVTFALPCGFGDVRPHHLPL